MNIAAITGPITNPLKPNIAIRYRLVTRTITVWLGDRLYRSYVYVIDEPKLVTPGGKLSDWEKSNLELFTDCECIGGLHHYRAGVLESVSGSERGAGDIRDRQPVRPDVHADDRGGEFGRASFADGGGTRNSRCHPN
jgi:hypothetical protein